MSNLYSPLRAILDKLSTGNSTPTECPNCGARAVHHTAVRENTTGKENRSWHCVACGEQEDVKDEL